MREGAVLKFDEDAATCGAFGRDIPFVAGAGSRLPAGPARERFGACPIRLQYKHQSVIGHVKNRCSPNRFNRHVPTNETVNMLAQRVHFLLTLAN